MTGAELLQLRQAAGLSQAQVGKLIGVEENTVWRWENGYNPIAEPTAIALRTKLAPLAKKGRA